MEVPEIDVDELAERRGNVVLVDVRQPDEYEEAHVPGAVLIPLGDLPDRLGEIPEGDLHVICQSGGRSQRAAEWLMASGRSATNVAGGTKAWVDSGREVATGSDRGA